MPRGGAPRSAIPLLVLLGALGLQLLLSTELSTAEPFRGTMGPPPDAFGLAIQSVGDLQFFYRARAVQLQHLGTLDGQVVNLSRLDYGRILAWFEVLDPINPESDVLAVLAAYVFRDSSVQSDVRQMVEFLEAHAARSPIAKWRFLAAASHNAQFRVCDLDLALRLAEKLARQAEAARATPDEGDDLPTWTRSLPVLVRTARGERDAARNLLQRIRDSDPNLPAGERRWIEFYLRRFLSDDPAQVPRGCETGANQPFVPANAGPRRENLPPGPSFP